MSRLGRWVVPAAALVLGSGAAGIALAEDPPVVPVMASRQAPLSIDSGERVANPAAPGPQLVYSTVVEVPGAIWLRLAFAQASLSGDAGAGTGAYLVMTSLHDGHAQRMHADHLNQWNNTSAYFNGDRVLVELYAHPGMGPSRIAMTTATAGEEEAGIETICDTSDDRVPSSDPRSGRIAPSTCSAWMINDTNGCLLTAGHCGPSTTAVVQFNTPLSTSGGVGVAPPPEDQYAVDPASIQRPSPTATGNDYSYFGVFPNTNTGLMPYQRQGQRYTLATSIDATQDNRPIRVTGYGTTSSPISPTWNIAQKTHVGPFRDLTIGATTTRIRYRTDTTGGNSGSPIIDETSGEAVGVHTHGGCSTSATSANAGTAITHPGLQNVLANPLSICATGKGTPTGDLYLLGDLANNFGTLNRTTAAFARKSQVGSLWQGLTYNPRLGVFYATDGGRTLFRIDPATGEAAPLAQFESTLPIISGLAYDAGRNILYGMGLTNGQLLRINPITAEAWPIGAPQGLGVNGLEFDHTRGILWGLDESTIPTRLVQIDTSSGLRTVIGTLGVGVSACRGLAVASDGTLYTLDPNTKSLYRVNPLTGLVTLVGVTNASLRASSTFGMAAAIPLPPICMADIATAGSPNPNAGPDGFVTGDDFDLFIQAFFGELPNGFGGLIADLYTAGSGAPMPDGFLTGDDFDGFTQAFFAGCP